MAETVKISVDAIRRRADARPLYDGAVADLEDSIRDIGLTTPITVRPIDGETFELIAGNHRFAACDALGWPEVDCIVVDDDDLTAELRMIDENLMRAELTPAERARQTARRKVIYEELHPETRHGSPGVSRQVGDTQERTNSERFTAETAGTSGRSERAIQRDVERGTKVCADALAIVQGTKLDTGAYLDKLKRLSPNEQVHAARRDLTISKKADRAEANARTSPAPTSATPAPEPTDPFASWLELTEQTSSLTADAIFDACPVRQRPVLSQRCEAVRAILDKLDALIERPPVRRTAA